MKLPQQAGHGQRSLPEAPAVEQDIFELPPSTAQEGFWLLDRLSPGNPAYNIAVRFRLRGPLDVALLERAFNEIVRRHEVLRTTFDHAEGEPLQVVHQSVGLSVAVSDLRHLLGTDRDAAEERLTLEEAAKRFDLSSGPLIRAQVLHLEPQEHVLLVTVHHIVSDGWSIGLITNELGAIYEAFARGLPSPLPDLPIQYGDFAVWQKEALEAGQMESQVSYWKRKLENLSSFEIPPDFPRTPQRTYNGHILSRLLPRALTDRLQELSAKHESTYFMTAVAALKILLLHHSGEPDVHIGTLLAGRHRLETETLIGAFINPMVLRTDLRGNPTFSELLTRERETVLEAVANQDVPFDQVVLVLNPKRILNRHPMFDVNFIFQRDFVRPLQFAGITLTAMPSRSPGAIYDLNFFMVERADGWRLSCEYNTDLFAAATVDRMLWQLENLLEGVATDPARAISELCALMEQPRVERDSILEQREAQPSPMAVTAFERPFVAPRNETEAQIGKIWQSLLGKGKVSVNANFFELGGHSLLAARLLARVEKVLGAKLALPVLFQAPTIEELAAVVQGQNPKATQLPVNALQSEGAKPPLFWVAGYSRFLPLANRLGSDRPFYGLPLDGLSNLPVPYRMEDVAACMLKLIREVQPEGPYFIGGWCIAGVIGYEVAQQLQQQGQEVALLIMIDAANPSYSRRLAKADAYDARLYFLGRKLSYHLTTMLQQGMRGASFYAWERIKTLHLRFTRRIFRLCYELHLRAGFPLISALKDYNRVAQIGLSGYYPKPYSGRVALVRSIARLAERYGARTWGWDELVSGLHVVETPGDHTEMFEHPNVDVLAEKLRASMETVTNNPVSFDQDANRSTAGAHSQRASGAMNSSLAAKPAS